MHGRRRIAESCSAPFTGGVMWLTLVDVDTHDYQPRRMPRLTIAPSTSRRGGELWADQGEGTIRVG